MINILNNPKHVLSILIWASLLIGSHSAIAITAAPFKTITQYDAARRVVGVIQADPDGTGVLKSPAIRHVYNASTGLLERTQSGYLNASSNANLPPDSWNGFTIEVQTVYTYDSQGRIKTEAQADSSGTRYTLTQISYDAKGRTECVAVRMNRNTYNSLPASACVLGAEGTEGPDRITKFEYENDYNDIVSTEHRAYGTNLAQQYASYTYYPRNANWPNVDQYANVGQLAGMLKSVTDANGNTTEYQYDDAARRNKLIFPDTSFESYTFDKNNNREQLVKRDGKTINYAYDGLNRLWKKDPVPSNEKNTYYQYDNFNLQTAARFNNETSGQGIVYQYSGFGELTDETNTLGVDRTVSQSYDANGNRTSVIHPDGKNFTYIYDGLDRLSQLRQANTNHIAYGFDNPGRLNSRSSGSASSNLQYGPISRVTNLAHGFAGTSFDFDLGYDYNPASQLIKEEINNLVYYHSEAGSVEGSYTINELNQYETAGGSSFGYDLNGNLTSESGPENNTYSYDIENRLINISGAQNASLEYDPLGRLYKVTVAGQTITFLYSGDSLVAEYNGSAMTHRYVFGNGIDQPLIHFTGSGTTNPNYLFANHQGSIIAATNSSGAAQYTNTYNEFGVPATNNAGRFGYTGQLNLPGLDLQYYKARIYYPKLGRFLQTDPVGYQDQMNLYAYVGNDPVSLTDSTGEIVDVDGAMTDEELEQLIAIVEEFAKTEAGAAAWQEMVESEHTFTFSLSTTSGNGFKAVNETDAQNPDVGSGGYIRVNPSTSSDTIDTTGSTERPASVGLAHEVGHALDANRGELILPRNVKMVPGTTPDFERNAVEFEDQVRSQMGLPLRETYFGSERVQRIRCGGRLCPGANRMSGN